MDVNKLKTCTGHGDELINNNCPYVALVFIGGDWHCAHNSDCPMKAIAELQDELEMYKLGENKISRNQTDDIIRLDAAVTELEEQLSRTKAEMRAILGGE